MATGSAPPPRSLETILRVTQELLASDGLAALTVDAIAARAGVSKTTIYRRWRNKDYVALEAFIASLEAELSFPDTGSAREDLRLQLGALAKLLSNRERRAVFTGLVGQSQHDPDLAAAVSEQLIAPRRAAAIEVLSRGVARGELRRDLDPGVVVETLYGAIYYRLLISHTAVTPRYIGQLLDQVFRGL